MYFVPPGEVWNVNLSSFRVECEPLKCEPHLHVFQNLKFLRGVLWCGFRARSLSLCLCLSLSLSLSLPLSPLSLPLSPSLFSLTSSLPSLTPKAKARGIVASAALRATATRSKKTKKSRKTATCSCACVYAPGMIASRCNGHASVH